MGGSSNTADDLFLFSLGEERNSYNGYPRREVMIMPKEYSEHGVEAARLLSNLAGLFSIDAAYDG